MALSMPTTILALLAVIALPAPALSQATNGPTPPARAEVLVLGTYHMGNPGRDIFNMQADDILAPRRQLEIAELIEALKRFRPTRIAIEVDSWDGKLLQQYSDFLAGKYTLTRNEVDQIAFRLAKEMGHKAVYAVDADGEFPYPRLVNYAKASGRTPELDAISAEFAARVKGNGDYLSSHTVLETLRWMNADAYVAEENALYYRMARIGEPGDWAGADLLADWFRRNARIYSNIAKLADSPSERILVIYGAGHLAWLHHDVASDPNLVLRKFAEFVH